MSDTINLPFYPASNRTPGFFVDVDGSKANTALFQPRALIVGQMKTGLAATNVPVLITSLTQAGQMFGVGSMIYEQIAQFYLSNTTTELWAVAVPEPTGSVATGTITFPTGTFGTGTWALYIGGESIPVPILAGDTNLTIAARALAMINANPDVAVTGALSTNVITLTSKHIGLLQNDIDIRVNYLGALGGEFNVTGFAPAIVAMSGGTGVPVFTTMLANLGDTTYDYICLPYNDTASLAAFDAFFSFSVGRWSWQSMLYGMYFTAQRGTAGTLATFGQARNSPFGTCLGFNDSPDPIWIVAADYCAVCALSLNVDPNVPLSAVVMNWAAPPKQSTFIRSVRNTLLYDGISTFTVNRAGQVILERSCTLYQLNTNGIPDNSYLDTETMFGLMLLIRDWQQEMARLYPRAKLLQDGNAIPAGSSATTAADIRLATIAWYRQECANGNAQDPDIFASRVLSQNAGNGLVKELLPFLLPQQLRQIAGDAQFTKP